MTEDELIAVVQAQAVARSLPPPAACNAVTAVEAAVGFAMPPLLRRLYLEVADGGFGPDLWEAVSLTDNGHHFGDVEDLATVYRAYQSDSDADSRPGLVPLVERGCCIWNMVDFSSPGGEVWEWDPNQRCLRHAVFPRQQTLAQWIERWNGPDLAPDPPPTDCAECLGPTDGSAGCGW